MALSSEFKRHKVPETCHPLIRWLFTEMNQQQCMVRTLGERTGLTPAAIAQWRYRSKPTLENFEAVLNALGYEITIRRRREPD